MPFDEEGSYKIMLKFAAVLAVVFFFVIFYLWQSIEVAKLKMDCVGLIREQKELVSRKDNLLFRREKLRSPALVDEYAARNSLRRALPGDSGILINTEKTDEAK